MLYCIHKYSIRRQKAVVKIYILYFLAKQYEKRNPERQDEGKITVKSRQGQPAITKKLLQRSDISTFPVKIHVSLLQLYGIHNGQLPDFFDWPPNRQRRRSKT